MRSSVRHTKLFPFFVPLCLLLGVCVCVFSLIYALRSAFCVFECIFRNRMRRMRLRVSKRWNRLKIDWGHTYIYRHGGLKMLKYTFSKQQATKLWCFYFSQNDQWTKPLRVIKRLRCSASCACFVTTSIESARFSLVLWKITTTTCLPFAFSSSCCIA